MFQCCIMSFALTGRIACDYDKHESLINTTLVVILTTQKDYPREINASQYTERNLNK